MMTLSMSGRSGVGSRRPGLRRDRGFSLVELSVALVVLAIAILGLLAAVIHSTGTQRASRENIIATNAARAKIEELRNSGNFQDIFKRYNTTAADNVAGANPGANFAVAGLQAAAGDADGMPGQIVFSQDPGTPTILRENLALPDLGFPAGMDVNGDGAVDAADHAADYDVLPVTIIIRWAAPGGAAILRFPTALYQRP